MILEAFVCGDFVLLWKLLTISVLVDLVDLGYFFSCLKSV